MSSFTVGQLVKFRTGFGRPQQTGRIEEIGHHVYKIRAAGRLVTIKLGGEGRKGTVQALEETAARAAATLPPITPALPGGLRVVRIDRSGAVAQPRPRPRARFRCPVYLAYVRARPGGLPARSGAGAAGSLPRSHTGRTGGHGGQSTPRPGGCAACRLAQVVVQGVVGDHRLVATRRAEPAPAAPAPFALPAAGQAGAALVGSEEMARLLGMSLRSFASAYRANALVWASRIEVGGQYRWDPAKVLGILRRGSK